MKQEGRCRVLAQIRMIYWKSIVVAGGIAYASLMRDTGVSLPPIVGVDKWVHGVMYLLLTWVLLWESEQAGKGRWQRWAIVAGIAIGYGGVMEVLQERFFCPRTGDWWDWLADCAGVAIGMITWWLIASWHGKRVDK